MIEQIFLSKNTQPGELWYTDDTEEGLSPQGVKDALIWAKFIKDSMNPGPLTIWTFSAIFAVQMAKLIKELVPSAEIVTKDYLWNDPQYKIEENVFIQMEKDLDEVTGNLAIIVPEDDYEDFADFLLSYAIIELIKEIEDWIKNEKEISP